MAQSPSFLGFKADYCAFATATVSSFAALAIGVYFKPKGCAGVSGELGQEDTGLVLSSCWYDFTISCNFGFHLPSTCCGNAFSSKLNII